jgi:hypothetical protein
MVYVAFVVGTLSFAIGRFIGMRAKRLLSAEQKTILPSSSRFRLWWWLSTFALFVGSIAVIEWTRGRNHWGSSGFIVTFALLCAGFAVADFQRICRSGLPQAYTRRARIDLVFSFFGLFLLVAAEIYREYAYVGQ